MNKNQLLVPGARCPKGAADLILAPVGTPGRTAHLRQTGTLNRPPCGECRGSAVFGTNTPHPAVWALAPVISPGRSFANYRYI